MYTHLPLLCGAGKCNSQVLTSAHSNYAHKQGAVTYSPKAVRGLHLHKKSCSKAQALLLPARQRLALFYSSPEPRLQQDKKFKGTSFISQELLD